MTIFSHLIEKRACQEATRFVLISAQTTSWLESTRAKHPSMVKEKKKPLVFVVCLNGAGFLGEETYTKTEQ